MAAQHVPDYSNPMHKQGAVAVAQPGAPAQGGLCSWKRFGICMIIAVVFAVGLGVGLGVGLRKDDDDDEAADTGVQYDVKEVPKIQASGALTGISAAQFESSPAIADAFKTSVAESAGVDASDVTILSVEDVVEARRLAARALAGSKITINFEIILRAQAGDTVDEAILEELSATFEAQSATIQTAIQAKFVELLSELDEEDLGDIVVADIVFEVAEVAVVKATISVPRPTPTPSPAAGATTTPAPVRASASPSPVSPFPTIETVEIELVFRLTGMNAATFQGKPQADLLAIFENLRLPPVTVRSVEDSANGNTTIVVSFQVGGDEDNDGVVSAEELAGIQMMVDEQTPMIGSMIGEMFAASQEGSGKVTLSLASAAPRIVRIRASPSPSPFPTIETVEIELVFRLTGMNAATFQGKPQADLLAIFENLRLPPVTVRSVEDSANGNTTIVVSFQVGGDEDNDGVVSAEELAGIQMMVDEQTPMIGSMIGEMFAASQEGSGKVTLSLASAAPRIVRIRASPSPSAAASPVASTPTASSMPDNSVAAFIVRNTISWSNIPSSRFNEAAVRDALTSAYLATVPFTGQVVVEFVSAEANSAAAGATLAVVRITVFDHPFLEDGVVSESELLEFREFTNQRFPSRDFTNQLSERFSANLIAAGVDLETFGRADEFFRTSPSSGRAVRPPMPSPSATPSSVPSSSSTPSNSPSSTPSTTPSSTPSNSPSASATPSPSSAPLTLGDFSFVKIVGDKVYTDDRWEQTIHEWDVNTWTRRDFRFFLDDDNTWNDETQALEAHETLPLVAIQTQNSMHVYATNNNTVIFNEPRADHEASNLAVHPTLPVLVRASQAGKIEVLDWTAGEPNPSFETMQESGAGYFRRAIKFLADGSDFVFADNENEVVLASNSSMSIEFPGLVLDIERYHSLLAVAHRDENNTVSVALVDPATMTVARSFRYLSTMTHFGDLALQPAENRFAIGVDNMIKIFDLTVGSPVETLHRHAKRIQSLAFHATRDILVSTAFGPLEASNADDHSHAGGDDDWADRDLSNFESFVWIGSFADRSVEGPVPSPAPWKKNGMLWTNQVESVSGNAVFSASTEEHVAFLTNQNSVFVRDMSGALVATWQESGFEARGIFFSDDSSTLTIVGQEGTNMHYVSYPVAHLGNVTHQSVVAKSLPRVCLGSESALLSGDQVAEFPNGVPAADADKCAEACAMVDTCIASSFNTTSGVCHLFASVSDAEPSGQMISCEVTPFMGPAMFGLSSDGSHIGLFMWTPAGFSFAQFIEKSTMNVVGTGKIANAKMPMNSASMAGTGKDSFIYFLVQDPADGKNYMAQYEIIDGGLEFIGQKLLEVPSPSEPDVSRSEARNIACDANRPRCAVVMMDDQGSDGSGTWTYRIQIIDTTNMSLPVVQSWGVDAFPSSLVFSPAEDLLVVGSYDSPRALLIAEPSADHPEMLAIHEDDKATTNTWTEHWTDDFPSVPDWPTVWILADDDQELFSLTTSPSGKYLLAGGNYGVAGAAQLLL